LKIKNLCGLKTQKPLGETKGLYLFEKGQVWIGEKLCE
jgi:hypothetical protein